MESTASTPEARPNLATVAALAGVSASTASLAFSGAGPVSEKTKARVLAAAATLNYAGPDPRAQGLRRGRSGIVGVIIEDRLSDAFRDPMNVAMFDGLADELGPQGASLLLLTGNAEGNLYNAPVDGVILIGCSTQLAASVNVFRQRGVPIVAVEAEPMDDVVAIDLDNRAASRALSEHLRELGHTQVAMVTLPLDPAHTNGPLSPELEAASEGFTATERILGVRDVFAGAGGVVASNSSIDDGFAAGLSLLTASPGSERPPTAIVAQSDLLAVGVIRAALHLGLQVPRDLSVVGFDGIRLEGIAPHDLTTMVQPAFEKGRAAGRAVLSLIEGGEAKPVAFESEFHAGATTAPPARAHGKHV